MQWHAKAQEHNFSAVTQTDLRVNLGFQVATHSLPDSLVVINLLYQSLLFKWEAYFVPLHRIAVA